MTLTDDEKQQIVLQAVVDFVKSPASPFADITTTAAASTAAASTTARTTSHGLKTRGSWKAKQLSGGYTNAAYQVYYDDDGDDSTTHHVDVSAQSSSTASSSSALSSPKAPALFCKLAFRHATATFAADTIVEKNKNGSADDMNHQPAPPSHEHVWNNHHQRTNCEYQIMRYIRVHHDLRDAIPIPIPYACLDVNNNNNNNNNDHQHYHQCQLLITEWTVRRRQVWAEQFLTGEWDRHIITQVATAFATLNAHRGYDDGPTSSSLVDTNDFNPSGRAYQVSVMPVVRHVFVLLQEVQKRPRPVDRVAGLVQKYGTTVCEQIANAMERNYQQDRQCLVHGDAHAFNILVVENDPSDDNNNINQNQNMIHCETTTAAKTTTNDTTTTPATTSIRIIDWELCLVGPVGRDIGLLMGWPMACALWHAHQRRETIALNMVTAIAVDTLWAEYAKQLVVSGTARKELSRIYRNGLAWCGWFLFVSLYVFGAAMEHFTYEVDTEEEHEHVLESIGMVGLELMRLGFCINEHPQMSLSDLQKQMKRIVELEIRRPRSLLSPPRVPLLPRRKFRPQKRVVPPISRSQSVTSWSSLHSFELRSDSEDERDVKDDSNENANHPRTTPSFAKMLPRHCVSAIADSDAPPPNVLTPTGSSLPFVIPVKGKHEKAATFKFIYR